MVIYIGLAIAIVAFFFLTFLNSEVFGAQPNFKHFKEYQNFSEGVFHNQSVTEVMSDDGSFFKILKEWINRSKDNVPKNTIPIIKTDLINFNPGEQPQIIWFGHSSYLIYIEGKKILVDPVFNRASPVSIMGKPFKMSDDYKVEDFPEIDILLITHDHYDHLDYEFIKKILAKTKKIVTSKGVDAHLKLWGATQEQTISLNWNESASVENFKFSCLPARHFSGRKFKRATTLWSSFALKTENYNLYLGGDSGFDTHFERIGNELGPFDLAILECGQYGKYWPYIHMLPEETIKASKLLKAKVLLPVHWGKFSLSTHSWLEPIERAVSEAEKQNVNLLTPKIGEPIGLTENQSFKKWWTEV
ncbi:MBL fold metallo-hydrolase [Pedobacter sp. SD-b]|uniref:MBL fold metallo-hydrolase n=1 Tax=Pedobacter segetis TaxID=2793069 RepID=A0ABS1BFP8_9SPHI|nr:MBL fold metallo-hydrolase [Pedobacter segetis]MBK0381678.1 MBL fold metallo-hydrolase [Pedobacter segetis]